MADPKVTTAMFVNDCLVQEPKVAKLSRNFGLLRFRVAWGRAGDVLWPMAPSQVKGEKLGMVERRHRRRVVSSHTNGLFHLTPEEDSQIVRSLTLCRQGERRERMVAIAITRLDLTAAELRAASAKSRDTQAARRMLALALVLEGADRKTAAETCGMDRQTLRDWVHRYNAEGLAGLSNHRSAPRPRRLDPGQVSELMAWLETGPDPAPVPVGDGVVRWRRRDLQRRLADRLGVDLHERTVGKYLAALGYRRLSVRPRHPKTDPEAQEAFKKASPRR